VFVIRSDQDGNLRRKIRSEVPANTVDERTYALMKIP